MSLNYFFNPRAIAIIGASSQKHKLGRQILDNIIENKFKGGIYPINLKNKKIAGLKAYVDISDVPTSRFNSLLTVIAIPAGFVLAEVEKCARLGVKNIIIISAGFKESGSVGKDLEADLVLLAEKYKINILGPNCLGFINNLNHLNATFAQSSTQIGNIALLSQSGAIGSAALDWLRKRNISLGYFLSLGNKAVINENDILEYLVNDTKIDLIGIYLEEIENGQKLMNLVSRLSKKKPVVILKAGKSLAGRQLALSHTGSLAGPSDVIRAGLIRAGAIYLDNLEELFNFCLLMKKSYLTKSQTRDLHIVTNAGGLAVLTADEISRRGLVLGSSLDVLGDALAERYDKALKKLLTDKKINNILVLLTPQTSTEPLKTAQIIVKLAKKFPHKIIMTSFLGGSLVDDAKALLTENKVPTFDFPEEAVQSFQRLIDYRERKLDLKTYFVPKVIPKQRVTDTDYLKSLALLEEYKIKTVKTSKLNLERKELFRYPVVVKAVGPAFLHKSDKGAVIVGIQNEKELRQTVSQLKLKNKRALISPSNYLIVQKEVQKFQEIILGIKRDESFGPIIMIGLGGIYTEVFNEVKMEIADLDLGRAKEIIKKLKIYPLLNGARGQVKYDISELAKALVNLARLANEHPEIKELDINPLFVQERGVLAGDVRVII